MKFKFPKKIQIGDVEWNIVYDKKTTGASVVYPCKDKNGVIKIGIETIKTNPSRFLSNVIHELKEVIQIEQGVWHQKEGTNDILFSYNHSQHTDLCARLTELLIHFIK